MTSTYDFIAPATGKCVPIEAVYDKTLSSKELGDGIAIFPSAGEHTVCAPCDCMVSMTSAAKRAVTILDPAHDIELMLCADIDDQGMYSPKFTLCAQEGQTVKAGEPLFTCDIDDIRAHGYQVEFPCILTNAMLSDITVASGDVVRGQTRVMTCEAVG